MNGVFKRAALLVGALLVVVFIASVFLGSTAAFAASSSPVWSFGVMGDTQWTTTDPAGQNPNAVAVSILKQVEQQFIDKGVKFVIQVGDLTENGADADIAVRANAAQMLYNAGVGFFPMRGNHETYTAGNNFGITAFRNNFPQTRGMSNTFGASNFTSPYLSGSFPDDLKGMSYSFDYGTGASKARLVIVDDWVTPNKSVSAAGYAYGYSIAEQQSWISTVLNQATRGTQQAFVFSHHNLIGENHQDSLFQGYTDANPIMQNAFFASLASNGVRYYISGHDHEDQRSIIASPDGLSKVQELICASNSSKFYTPKSLTDSKWYGQKSRETSVEQELATVGFYIFTVDGPRVTVDYYSDDHGNWSSDNQYPDAVAPAVGSHVTPTFHFVKKSTWGYSTNGKEFLVGGTSLSYTQVQDTFGKTTAKILSGVYDNLAMDYTLRHLTQTVDTGWSTPRAQPLPPFVQSFGSDVLTLWGMGSLGAERGAFGAVETDSYALSLSYNPTANLPVRLGAVGIATPDKSGRYVNAVNGNIGGTKKFVLGPWNSSYGLGTYGIDLTTKTAWAVLNYNADFVVASGLR